MMARQKRVGNREGAWIDIKQCETLARWKGHRIGMGMLGGSVPYRVLRTRNGAIILEGPGNVADSSFILFRLFFPSTVYMEYSIPEVVALMFETGRGGKKAARRAFPAEAERWVQFQEGQKAGSQL
jgi:hypothetical protein